MWIKCLKVVLLMFIQLGNGEKNGPRIKVGKGELLGSWRKSVSGRTYASFEGIPYALPPVGDRMFKDPVECEDFSSLSTTFNATQMTEPCKQIEVDVYGEHIRGTEDCLYLAVYTSTVTSSGNPVVNTSANFPVIFYIVGGGFTCGLATGSSPETFMDKDVVFVTANFRMGILGFLSTEDDVVPGNMGMKDQVMVLQWIKRNIHYFGGNPNSVTIMGFSSGGSSVDLHYVSPISKGLFHRGYSQSGSSLNQYVISLQILKRAKLVAADLNCTTRTNQEMVECFRHSDLDKMLKSTKQFKRGTNYYFLGFGPVVEIPHKNAFITEHPYKYLETGNFSSLPWIVSNTADEGVVAIAGHYDDLDYVDNNWDSYASEIFGYKWNVPTNYQSEIAMKVREFYLDNAPISKDTSRAVSQAMGDRIFLLSNQQAAILHARYGEAPVYYYIFSYRGSHSLSDVFMKNPRDLGVTHSDDSLYLMRNPGLDFETSNRDRAMSHCLVDMMYSFVRDGIPKIGSLNWEPLDGSEEIKYVDIISPRIQLIKTVNNYPKKRFWTSLGFDKYGGFHYSQSQNNIEYSTIY